MVQQRSRSGRAGRAGTIGATGAEIVDVVERASAERVEGSRLISLAENSFAPQALQPNQLGILTKQGGEKLKQFGLELVPRLMEDRLETRLSAGNRIGTIRFPGGRDFVDVVIEPKVRGAHFLQMLQVANGGLGGATDTATAYTRQGSHTGLIVQYVVTRIWEFLNRVAFRDYSPHYEPGSRRPKGRLDIRSYATESLPRLQRDRMGCQYFEYSADVVENQVLLSALFIAGRVLSEVPRADRGKVRSMVAAARHALAGVSVRSFNERDLERIRYNPRNQTFAAIHKVCALLLTNVTVALNPGRKLAFLAFSLDMSSLFERYVRALLSREFGQRLFPPKELLRFSVSGREGTVKLDGLLALPNGSLIVECKYKLVDTENDFSPTLIGEQDVYQAIAYSVHSDIEVSHVLLIYPTLQSDGAAARVVTQIKSFRRDSKRPIVVHVVLVSLSAPWRAVQQSLADLARNVVGVPAAA